jgi:hypothetical protein
MKSKIVSIALALIITMSANATFAVGKNNAEPAKLTPQEKLLSNFEKQFKTETEPAIYASKNGFIVQSQADNHKVTAAYSAKGNWVYSITHFASDNLAKNVMDLVRENYENYYISGMEKVDQPGYNSVFIVHIKNNDSYKTVRVTNNDVELVQDIPKA